MDIHVRPKDENRIPGRDRKKFSEIRKDVLPNLGK